MFLRLGLRREKPVFFTQTLRLYVQRGKAGSAWALRPLVLTLGLYFTQNERSSRLVFFVTQSRRAAKGTTASMRAFYFLNKFDFLSWLVENLFFPSLRLRVFA